MTPELEKLIGVIEGGEGIERFASRSEREIFRQWLVKFKQSLPKLEDRPTPLDVNELSEPDLEDLYEDVNESN